MSVVGAGEVALGGEFTALIILIGRYNSPRGPVKKRVETGQGKRVGNEEACMVLQVLRSFSRFLW